MDKYLINQSMITSKGSLASYRRSLHSNLYSCWGSKSDTYLLREERVIENDTSFGTMYRVFIVSCPVFFILCYAWMICYSEHAHGVFFCCMYSFFQVKTNGAQVESFVICTSSRTYTLIKIEDRLKEWVWKITVTIHFDLDGDCDVLLLS